MIEDENDKKKRGITSIGKKRKTEGVVLLPSSNPMTPNENNI